MTLEEILQRIGSYVDQDSATPTDSDLAIRSNFVNFAYEEWANSYDWDETRSTYTFSPVTASTVSVALPADYMKIQSPLYEQTSETSRANKYTEIKESDHWAYNNTDKVFYVSGNRSIGYTLLVPRGLTSGATCELKYQSHPTSLATLTAIPVMSNPNYLVQRGIAFVLESRGDTRFPTAKSDADRILGSMIEHQNVIRSGGGENRIPNYYAKRGYRIGRR